MSVRLKLTISYAGFLVLAGAVLLGLWAVLFEFFPQAAIVRDTRAGMGGAFVPGRSSSHRAFGLLAVTVLGFLLVFGLAGGWILSGRMLAPLNRITDATRMAANGSLSHRVRLEGRKDEFRELADSLDTMLAQLESHVAEQRRFAANASHELRTPLAITQTRIVSGDVEKIDLTEALLLLSRADQRSFVRVPVDLSLIAEEAAETLLPLAEKHGVTIETSGEISPTIGSHTLLLQMTTNLLHNAIVHNHPEGGSVQASTAVGAESVTLMVENTGKELTPGLISTLTEPFQRGAARVRGDHAGVGLGLAIVRSIVEAHDGTLTLSPGTAGGLRVSVRLPVARD